MVPVEKGRKKMGCPGRESMRKESEFNKKKKWLLGQILMEGFLEVKPKGLKLR